MKWGQGICPRHTCTVRKNVYHLGGSDFTAGFSVQRKCSIFTDCPFSLSVSHCLLSKSDSHDIRVKSSICISLELKVVRAEVEVTACVMKQWCENIHFYTVCRLREDHRAWLLPVISSHTSPFLPPMPSPPTNNKGF